MPASLQRKPLDPESSLTLVFLAALVALGPLSVDMYLPAMPAMQRAFDTDIASMHITLSAYLWGFAAFHLACGPLADRFGRRPLLIAGTLLFVLASAGCALAKSAEELTVFRFIQGIGACVGPTLARTITRDIFGPRRAAKALSLIAMLMALAPAVAPGLGGIMLRYVAWPSVFVFLAGYGLLVLWMVSFRLTETLMTPQSLHPGRIAANYLLLLRDPVYIPMALGAAFVYAGLVAYLACSGFVFIDMLGVPPEYFGLLFLTTVVGYISGSALSARLANHQQPAKVVLAGSVLAAVSTLCMLCLHLRLPNSVLAIIMPMAFYAAAMGIVMPHAQALAMANYPHIAGTTSSLLGFLQMGLSALVTAGVGTVLGTSPLPMITLMMVITLLAIVLFYRARRRIQHKPIQHEQV